MELSIRRVQTLCSTDRILGAIKIGLYWAIPIDAEQPKDERIKSGKYVKKSMTVLHIVSTVLIKERIHGSCGRCKVFL